jgi:hypothetical protein
LPEDSVDLTLSKTGMGGAFPSPMLDIQLEATAFAVPSMDSPEPQVRVKLGGRIWADLGRVRRSGMGATFILTLPRSD